jgi:hypothetical protein
MTTGFLQQMVARGVRFPPPMKSLVVVETEPVSYSAVWTARRAGLTAHTTIDEQAMVSCFAAAVLAWAFTG